MLYSGCTVLTESLQPPVSPIDIDMANIVAAAISEVLVGIIMLIVADWVMDDVITIVISI